MKERKNVAKRFGHSNLWFCFATNQSHIFDIGTQCRRCSTSGKPQVGATFGDNLLPCVLCYPGIGDDMARKTAEERFWERVQKTDTCWIWVGEKTMNGYGHISIGGKYIAAHRYSWELHNGPVPSGLFVCRTCDVLACMNPSHLILYTTTKYKTIEQRFWEGVKKIDTCWLWERGKTTGGYGAFPIGKSHIAAHRYSWELHNGSIPDGLFVCHSCDVRNCVNPAHLWLGTAQDNMNDMKKKGRASHTYGEENGSPSIRKNLYVKCVQNIRVKHRHNWQKKLEFLVHK